MERNRTVLIEVACPACGSLNEYEIPAYTVSRKEYGCAICKRSFIVETTPVQSYHVQTYTVHPAQLWQWQPFEELPF